MPSDPYRVPPEVKPPACDHCGTPIPGRSASYERSNGTPLCRMCFFGQYDLLALFGIGALVAGAITGSGALLFSGLFIPGIGAYAIYRGGI